MPEHIGDLFDRGAVANHECGGCMAETVAPKPGTTDADPTKEVSHEICGRRTLERLPSSQRREENFSVDALRSLQSNVIGQQFSCFLRKWKRSLPVALSVTDMQNPFFPIDVV